MAFADTAVRNIVEGIAPCRILLAGTVGAGSPIGYSGGWVAADANAGVSALLVAGEAGVSGETITAYRLAVISGPTGATAGAAAYLSDTAGGYSDTASTTSPQRVGTFLSATKVLFDPETFTKEFTVQYTFGAAEVTAQNVFWIAPFRATVTKIQWIHETIAGQTGTATVERLQGTEAPGAGDELTAAGINMEATTNTLITPALTSTAAHLTLEIGNRLALELKSGASTSLANACVTVTLVKA